MQIDMLQQPPQRAWRAAVGETLGSGCLAGSTYLCDVCLACAQERSQFVCRHLAVGQRVAVPARECVERILDAGDHAGAAAFNPLQQRAQRRVRSCPG